MSVYSMTGFAATQTPIDAEEKATGLGLEIRSVNSRFLDIQCKIPDIYRTHETALRKLTPEYIKRGEVEIRLFTLGASAVAASVLSVQTLVQLATVQDQTKAWLPGARDLSVAGVLRLGGGASTPVDVTVERDSLQTIAVQGFKALVAARKKEGARLVKLLQENISQLRDLVVKAQPLVPQIA